MKCPAYLVIVLFILVITPLPIHALDDSDPKDPRGPRGTIKVGVFPFKPFNFIDSSGIAQGFYPDLLREIVKDEVWKIEFVPGSWAEGLDRLQTQEIDLIISVAYSPERAEVMDYNYESVVELWGQVFLRPEDNSQNINDFDGKRVAVMRKDICGTNFIKTAGKFDVHCEIIEFASHTEVFNAVQQKAVDAGVAPQHFGLKHAKEHNLVGSTIIFSPFSIYFASKKGTQHELLSHIDAHLSDWKKDKNSYYYQSLNHWLGGLNPSSRIPAWLTYTALAISALLLFFVAFTLLLKKTVNSKIKELAQSEVKLLEAQEIASLGRWELDLTNNQLIWSDSIYAILEINRETYTPSYETLFHFVHPDDRSPLDTAYQRSVKEKTPYQIEHRLLMSDGRIKWVNELGHTEYNTEGMPIRTVGTVQEITERKKAEIALLESKDRYHSLVHTAMDGFFVLDEQGCLLEVNETYSRMSGYSSRELLSMKISDLEAIGMAEDIDAHMRLIIAKGEDRFKTRHRRKDGSLFDVEIGVQYRSGEDVEFVVFLRDITEANRAEEEKKKLQNQLFRSQKLEAIGTLAGGIAHDFNNILTAVLGYAELAKEDIPPGSIVAHEIDQIIGAGNRAKDLVKQILDFSRQDETDSVPLQPGIIMEETLKLLRSSLPTTITIEQNIEMDSGIILADPTKIHQILMNLCTNSFHAMENAGGTLSVSLIDKALTQRDLVNIIDVHPGAFVQITIKDNGAGIPPAILESIFNPYFTTKETGKGSGMGLAIVHGIVKSYGGFITCHSTVGEGTVFQIHLPSVGGKIESKTKPIDLIPSGNERILLIDDEEMLADLGKAMLERLGYNVTARCSSLEALETFRNKPDQFDLVITDQTMPGMTGAELAREMLLIHPEIPIILCTGYSTVISEEKAKKMGIKEFIMKPITKKSIARLIRKVLDT
ncbi:MAG: PAS domain S-box protein [Desulfobulbaceae bacterium]|nr:PAS domain S-box protein [Desulfobulbaceae bacterium]